MPIGFLERMAKQKKIPLSEAEDLWGTAKRAAKRTLKTTEEVAPGLEALTTSIFLNMLNLKKFSQSKTSESKNHRSERLAKKLDKMKTEQSKEGSFTEDAPEWWQKMSHDQQKAYLDEHPNSQMSQQLDEHIQKSVEKKTKSGGLTDKEKEIAAKHYEAKQREKDGPAPDSDEDELVDAKIKDPNKDKDTISLKDEDSEKKPEPKEPEPKEEQPEEDELVKPDPKKPEPKEEPEEDDSDDYKLDDSDIPKLDSAECKKTRDILNAADAKKIKSLLSDVKDDPNSPLSKRMRRYLDAKSNEGQELTADEKQFKKALGKKPKRSSYDDLDYSEREDKSNKDSEKALKAVFDDDQTHDERLASLREDPNSAKAKRFEKYVGEKRKHGKLTAKENELAKALEEKEHARVSAEKEKKGAKHKEELDQKEQREDQDKMKDMDEDEKKAYLLHKNLKRVKELGFEEGEGAELLKAFHSDMKAQPKKVQDAWKKLQKVDPVKLTKKDQGLWANMIKAHRENFASKIADPEHAYHSLAKLKSGEKLTELDRTNVKRAMLKVGGAVLITGILAGLAFFAAPMLPGLIESYLEYKSQHNSGGGDYSVFSSDKDKDSKPSEKEQSELLNGMADDFATWLAKQDPTKFK